MNDRTRKRAATMIAIAGSSASALAVAFFGGIKNIAGMILLCSLAGTLGHFAFTWLGTRLMRLEKRLTRGRSGGTVYGFGKLPAEEASLAGGKGRVLAQLYQAGFPVPDGCILLPTAFDEDEMIPAAWEQVRGQLERLRAGKQISFAVRSSALSEDSALASFAGEFESLLDVRLDDDIRAAIQAVRLSRYSARVNAYRQAQGLDGDDLSMAVIIQKLIQPDFSGVLFTADPLTGNLM